MAINLKLFRGTTPKSCSSPLGPLGLWTEELQSEREMDWASSNVLLRTQAHAQQLKCGFVSIWNMGLWALGLYMALWVVSRVQKLLSKLKKEPFSYLCWLCPFEGSCSKVVGLQLPLLKIHYGPDEIIKNKSNTLGSLVVVSWKYFCKSWYKNSWVGNTGVWC